MRVWARLVLQVLVRVLFGVFWRCYLNSPSSDCLVVDPPHIQQVTKLWVCTGPISASCKNLVLHSSGNYSTALGGVIQEEGLRCQHSILLMLPWSIPKWVVYLVSLDKTSNKGILKQSQVPRMLPCSGAIAIIAACPHMHHRT